MSADIGPTGEVCPAEGAAAKTAAAAGVAADEGGSGMVPVETKTQRKRRLKREERAVKYKQRKAEKKAEKKAVKEAARRAREMAGAGSSATAAGTSGASSGSVPKRSAGGPSRGEKRKLFLEAVRSAPTVVVDLDFEEQCTSKEKRSCIQQLMYCYGLNRRANKPVRLSFNSVRGDTKAGLEKIGGFSEWLGVVSDSRPYEEIYAKEQLVYLSADSPNVLEALDKDKVYVIGGIVDRNRLKGATFDKAKAQGIATARLPILEHCSMDKTLSRVLAVNHVFDILVAYHSTGDWRQALSRIPQRKGFKVESGAKSRATGGADGGGAGGGGTGCSTRRRRVAVFTGGSSGIGLGAALALAGHTPGVDMLLVARGEDTLASAQRQVVARREPGVSTAPTVFTLAADCSQDAGVATLRDYLASRWDQVALLVCAAGTFCWDGPAADAASTAAALMASNFDSREKTVAALLDLVKAAKDSTSRPGVVIVVGSQAGKPGFKEEMEAKEGKGATDKEQGYIAAMAAVRQWCLKLQTQVDHGSSFKLHLVEPGLVDTPLARREFAAFGIDWSTVPSPEVFGADQICPLARFAVSGHLVATKRDEDADTSPKTHPPP